MAGLDDSGPRGDRPDDGPPAPAEPPAAAPEPDDRPLVAWGAPTPAIAADAPVGTVARIVAYLIDGLVVGVLPALPLLFGMFQTMGGLVGTFDLTDPAQFQARADAFAAAIQPYALGSTVGSVALSFVYFVGLWTSGGQATLGMRVVRFRIADAATGGPLALGQATRRWVAMGVPFSLFGVVPLLGFNQIASAVPFWQLFLLVTIAADPLRLGLHDKFARTRMERSAAAGLRVGLGCAAALVIYVALYVVFAGILLSAVGLLRAS